MRIRWRGFELPTEVECEESSRTDTYGKFIIEPFERGFGITIGNSLRRVLLSSLQGVAVTSVRFDKVPHEYSTIPGVYEDVADIVLNLKQLRVRIVGDGPCMLRIEKSGKGEVTGATVKCDESSEVCNKDVHIATLTDDVEFNVEMIAEKGRGYVTSEEREKDERQIGSIPLDARFSPVTRVRYKTENTRVGQRTNYDRLVLEIWTDGTVTPAMALTETGKIVRKHLNPIVQYSELGPELEERRGVGRLVGPGGMVGPELAEKLAMPLSELELSVRSYNCLKKGEGVETVGQLVEKTAEQLLQMRNFGQTSLEEVIGKLEKLGLSLSVAPDEEAPE